MGHLGPTEGVAVVVALLFAALPYLLLLGVAYFLFSRSRLGRAIMARTGEGSQEIPPAIAHELAALRQEVAELQERLDFTERVVIRLKEDRPGIPERGDDVTTPPEIAAIR